MLDWQKQSSGIANLRARDLITAVQQEVIEWTDGRGASDDVTFFVIKAL